MAEDAKIHYEQEAHKATATHKKVHKVLHQVSNHSNALSLEVDSLPIKIEPSDDQWKQIADVLFPKTAAEE